MRIDNSNIEDTFSKNQPHQQQRRAQPLSLKAASI